MNNVPPFGVWRIVDRPSNFCRGRIRGETRGSGLDALGVRKEPRGPPQA
jgi:hypothetical protein